MSWLFPNEAHANREGRALELFIEREKRGFFKLFRSMRSKAVGDAGQLRRKHRDDGRIGAEMGMYMVNPVFAAPQGKHSRLHGIGKMSEEASIRMPAHLCGEGKNLREFSWLSQECCNKTA